MEEEVSCLENVKQVLLDKVNDPLFIQQFERKEIENAFEEFTTQNNQDVEQLTYNDNADSNESIYYSLEENEDLLNDFKKNFVTSTNNLPKQKTQQELSLDMHPYTLGLL